MLGGHVLKLCLDGDFLGGSKVTLSVVYFSSCYLPFWSWMWEDQSYPGPRARPGSAPAVYLCCDVIPSKEKDVI